MTDHLARITAEWSPGQAQNCGVLRESERRLLVRPRTYLPFELVLARVLADAAVLAPKPDPEEAGPLD